MAPTVPDDALPRDLRYLGQLAFAAVLGVALGLQWAPFWAVRGTVSLPALAAEALFLFFAGFAQGQWLADPQSWLGAMEGSRWLSARWARVGWPLSPALLLAALLAPAAAMPLGALAAIALGLWAGSALPSRPPSFDRA